MQRIPVVTKDGSQTVSIPQLNVTYHSIHGAVQESMHVFINAGLNNFRNDSAINILEIGLGTGLNTFLSFQQARQRNLTIQYTAIEKYPLTKTELIPITYPEQLGAKDMQNSFDQIHESPWNVFNSLSENFQFRKLEDDLATMSFDHPHPIRDINLVYFDAFGPATQPELWTTAIFEKISAAMSPDGLLVTYCSKGDVRRAMKAAELRVEKIPGPPGKREMVRAWKS